MEINRVINMFVEHQRLIGNSDNTVAYYKQMLGQFIEYFGYDMQIEEITIDKLNDYKRFLQQRHNMTFTNKKKNAKLSTVTIASNIRAIRAFFNYLRREGFTELDMMLYPVPKEQRGTVEILSMEEIERLMMSFNEKSALGCRNKAMISLMLDSGLRLNEVITLKIKDVKFEQNIVTVTGKGNKRRSVPLGIQTKKVLFRYLHYYRPMEDIETGIVFLSRYRIPLTRNSIQLIFQRLKHNKKLDIPRIHAHMLRHTFATQYLINGGDAITLQLILGHSTLSMVNKYIHVANSVVLFNKKNNSLLDNVYKNNYR